VPIVISLRFALCLDSFIDRRCCCACQFHVLQLHHLLLQPVRQSRGDLQRSRPMRRRQRLHPLRCRCRSNQQRQTLEARQVKAQIFVPFSFSSSRLTDLLQTTVSARLLRVATQSEQILAQRLQNLRLCRSLFVCQGYLILNRILRSLSASADDSRIRAGSAIVVPERSQVL
jgi:hypothetical protein